MTSTKPRMRMLAGPNGSGKSTVKALLPPRLLGIDINPDEIEKIVIDHGHLDLGVFKVVASDQVIRNYFRDSTLIAEAGLGEAAKALKVDDGVIQFGNIEVNAYLASVAAALIRDQMIAQRESFTMETVMSALDKIDALAAAQAAGFRTYLYYVATSDPQINISRVAARVRAGGHDVPRDKIVSRYARSLENLYEAIRRCNRAYIWDNSGPEPVLLAEVEEDQLELKVDSVPAWFHEAVLKKLA